MVNQRWVVVSARPLNARTGRRPHTSSENNGRKIEGKMLDDNKAQAPSARREPWHERVRFHARLDLGRPFP